ncbi:MAG: hydantoinase/oxoprolinase family protein [Alphaproteobacteria bacterium]
MSRYKIGIDVGGTFTDFLLLGPGDATQAYKFMSTPDDPSRAVMAGLGRMAADRNLSDKAFLEAVDIIVHGTTVTTNAVLTGKIAKTGLITTRGFRDALQMRRGLREVPYDNKYPPAPELIARRLRRPVAERIDAEGKVLTSLTQRDVDAAVQLFQSEGIEAVAVCFMHAYANPAHEQAAGKRVAALMPDAYLSVSTQVLPQVRFYDRVSTTVLNAAVGPILRNYLTNLTRKLGQAGFKGVLLIMQSNGGVTTPEAAMQLAASTLLSGPAAAPVAGLAYMAPHNERSFITVDMGGTSFDAALVRDGAPQMTTHAQVNRYALALPSLDINTIGAGGGSIAWIDDGGLLRMGPQSAGAAPGPACYGRGGMLPACSDANLVLGYLDPNFFAGGKIPLNRAAAELAIKEHVADKLGMSTVQAAYGMYQIINVNMASGIREITVQKGYDPREFTMVCAGGAGPVHACMIAKELDIRRILVPRESAIFCAAGMLRSDLRHDYVRSLHTALDPAHFDRARALALFAEMQTAGRKTLASEGIAAARCRFDHALDLRYRGQYHEVTVEIDAATAVNLDLAAIADAFHNAHNRLYGYDLRNDGTAIDLISLRLTAVGQTDKPTLRAGNKATSSPETARKGARPAYLPSARDFAAIAVYDLNRLTYGHRFTGPALIESDNTTTFVTDEFDVSVDELGSLILTAC